MMSPIRLSAVILTTLKDLDRPGITGVMYAAMVDRIDLETFNRALDVLNRAGLTRNISKHEIELTEQGRIAADEIDALLQKSSAKA